MDKDKEAQKKRSAEEMLEQIHAGVTEIREEQKTYGERLTTVEERLGVVEERTVSRSVSLPDVDEQKEEFSFLRACRAISTGQWKGAEFEREVFDQTEKRALSQGSDSAGGYIVPTEYVAVIIEILRAKTVTIALGATEMPNLVGSPVEIPKQTGGATGYWVGENNTITDSDQAFGQIALTPNQASGLTKLSNRLLKLSNPGAEMLVRRDLAATIARLIDLAALRGTGASNQPLGVANTGSINTVAVGTNGGPITYALLQDMITAIDTDNALDGKIGWAFHPQLRGEIAKLVDGDSRPLFLADLQGVNSPSKLLGYEWKTTSQIPVNLAKGSGTDLTEIYLANWEELIIGYWGGLELLASQETSSAFTDNQTWVRIIQEIDTAVRHPESFCLLNDADSGL